MTAQTNGRTILNRYVVPILAAAAIVLTMYLAYLDKPSSATVAGVLSIILILVDALPVVESFEAWGLKAKLRAQVQEAGVLLPQLRKAAEVSARLQYLQLAWMNRMGSPALSTKRQMLSEIDQLLNGLGTTPEQRAEMKAPFLQMHSFDLFNIWHSSFQTSLSRVRQRIDQERSSLLSAGPIESTSPALANLNEQLAAVSAIAARDGKLYEEPRIRTPIEWIEVLLDLAPITPNEAASLRRGGLELDRIVRDCWKQGTITLDAEAFVDRFEGHHEAYRSHLGLD